MAQFIDPSEPIAIVGLGGIFPGSKDIPGFWRNIIGKVDSVIEVPQDRWDWRLYYDPNPAAPDKTYSKIGGFVRDFTFDPLKLRIPPPVAQQMDTVQQLAVAASAEAFRDSGYDQKPFDRERTAVVFGNSMGGPKKEATDLRVYTAHYRRNLELSPSFSKLPESARQAISAEVEQSVKAGLCTINEDTMPGELSNVIAGRVANVFNLNGPNFTVDAACAGSLAALSQAVSGLRFKQYDMAITGGVDQMMAVPAYVKFCKIGALSPDGSRPFDAGANGFVMGEGAGVFVLKRLSDARRDGDRIYALIRSIGASSDGRGKGITAPNPKGQKLAIERAFEGLNYKPEDVGLLEAHGTSTKVGDVVEVQAAAELFGAAKPGSIALGSVKSQIGHLKAAAGAAGLAKAVLALHYKTLPPSINFKTPNPGIDWTKTPFYVNTDAREWSDNGKPRRANVSSFGFGGTNFHVTLEEADERTTSWTPSLHAVSEKDMRQVESARPSKPLSPGLGGEAFLVRGKDAGSIFNRLENLKREVPSEGPLTAAAHKSNARDAADEYILALSAETGAKLVEKIDLVLKTKDPAIWKKTPPAFKPKGIHPGKKASKRPKIGFMFPGQGSQYVDMLKDLSEKYQVVADTFAEADAIMVDLVGSKLTDILFTKGGETPEQIAAMQNRIKQTEITQPAVLTADIALMRLLQQYGVEPDVVCGHSLGEYGAMVAAGVLDFKDALLAVSSRAKEMTVIKVDDVGKMASIAAPVEKVEPVLREVKGYVIAANKNCPIQTVIAGATKAVEEAVARFSAQGIQAQMIEVSHAFHSEIVAPAQAPYGNFLKRVGLKMPRIPILSNVNADYYPKDEDKMLDLIVRQIASPVEFIRQVERMYKDGVRVFVEVGPKRALTAFVTSVLEDKDDATIVPTNHPKKGGIQEFNDLLARLEAAGVELDLSKTDPKAAECLYTPEYKAWSLSPAAAQAPAPAPAAPRAVPAAATAAEQDLLARWDIHLGPVAVSGIAAGTPGEWDRVFREDNLNALLRGQNLIGKLEQKDLDRQLDKNILRLIKSDTGDHRIERIESAAEVVQLAAKAGAFDLASEFGFKESIARAMDVSSRLAVAAGILALKDAGIPLIRTYKRTTTGGTIPTGWALPESMRLDTGVIFASAYPSIDSMASEVSRYLSDHYRRKPLRELAKLFESLVTRLKDPEDRVALQHWYATNFMAYQERYGNEGPYEFSRDFLLRVMPLGHAQLAQWVGAQGPACHVSAACASTTQAIGMAEDWIRLGRAKRVIVIAGDDVTGPNLREWMTSGFLAAGAATNCGVVSEAALPFDRRRRGMILGMGAAGIVVESSASVAERGMRPLAEILASQFENSAYHVTRLEVNHVAEVMGRLLAQAERRYGLQRSQVASKTLFMSHETYTPARGGSASAEVEALKRTFGGDAARIVVTNTKGYTGHTMGASVEDPVAIRALVTGLVPPIANYKEADPELSGITLSKGGEYDIEYAIRLAAGFGSQIAMTLMRRGLKKGDARVADAARHSAWLKAVSGQAAPVLETVQNTLRVKETAEMPVPRPAPVPVATAKASAAVPAAAPAPAPAAAPRSAPVSEDAVRADIVALVGEKTGYPAEMLELDLDMEADLGIDTVKQAELIGMIREKYGIPRKENLSLKDYPTLRHVIRFVMEGAGGFAAVQAPPAAPVRNGSATVHAAPAPMAQPAPAPAAAPSRRSDLNEDAVRAEITALVSEKTGYPAEMLELDLDMEADLGIDTVKQAELIGMIREKYGIPRKENLSLKDYPTLRHVIRFVMEGAAGSAAVQAPAAPVAAAVEPAPAAVPTPVETPMAETSANAGKFRRWTLEAYARPAANAPVSLSKERAVLILAANDETAKPFADAVSALGGNAAVLRAADWPTTEKAEAAVRGALKNAPAQGILDVTGLSLEDFAKLTPSSFDKAYRKSTRAFYMAARALREDLAASPKGSWILSLTRLGGTHGAAKNADINPLAGALAGLTKALRRELEGVRVVAIDFDANASAADMAKAALAELGSDDDRLEVGFKGGVRQALQLRPIDLPEEPKRKLTSRSVVLITGGGQGLGAELAKEFARRYKCPLVLFGRTPLLKEAVAWARMSDAELKALKTKMWEDLKKDPSRKATPALLEREFSKVTKSVGLQRNIEDMCRFGSKVVYVAADLADGAEVSKAVKTALKSYAAIDVVIHAAGLEESKLLADKKPEDFDRIFAAKAHGAFYLLKSIPATRNQAWLFFSSVVGRFGNIGQTDYAAASDFLAKLASRMGGEGKAAMTFDLTAFSEIGMATRGGVELFLKSQGVDFMPPKVGVEMMLDELKSNPGDPEILLAGSLGKLDSDGLMKAAPAPAASKPTSSGAPSASPPAKAASATVSRTFSMESDPWLADHSIGGTPYVAGVMGLELFAKTLAEAGEKPAELADVRFALPIKLLRNKPVTVRCQPQDGGLALLSDFIGPTGIKMGGPRTHFTARPSASSQEEFLRHWKAAKKPAPLAGDKFAVEASGIYQAYFHGPSFQVLAGVLSLDENQVLALYRKPSKPLWPEGDRPFVFFPMLIEAAFQACGYRDLHFAKRMTLPDSIGRVRVFDHGTAPEELYVWTRFKGPEGGDKSVYDAYVYDNSGRLWVALEDYRMIAIS